MNSYTNKMSIYLFKIYLIKMNFHIIKQHPPSDDFKKGLKFFNSTSWVLPMQTEHLMGTFLDPCFNFPDLFICRISPLIVNTQ